jgi:hypothetical protein
LVKHAFESKYTPLVFRRLGKMIRAPGDVGFTLQLAYFMWRVPAWLDRKTLPELLDALGTARRPAAPDTPKSLERITRLSRPWFKLPPFRSRNTCYVRALMFYRFVDPHRAPLHIHFVVEPGRTQGARLRGHAWVTVGDQIIEPPLPDVLLRSRSIYTHPH